MNAIWRIEKPEDEKIKYLINFWIFLFFFFFNRFMDFEVKKVKLDRNLVEELEESVCRV